MRPTSLLGRPRRLLARRAGRRPDQSHRPAPSRSSPQPKGDDDARSPLGAAAGPATAGWLPGARSCAGRGACSAASGGSKSSSLRSWHSRLQPRSAASRSCTTRAPRSMASSARPPGCSCSTAPIRRRSRPGSDVRRGVVRDDGRHRPPQGARARRRREGGLPSRRTRTAPTAASSSRSAMAATRPAPARSPSPTVWPSSCGVRSGRPSLSTESAGPSSASLRTHAS